MKGWRGNWNLILKKYIFSYDGEIFHQHGNSKVEHYEVSLANSYGSPLVVGGVGTNKVEKFDISTNVWTEVADYAFGTV